MIFKICFRHLGLLETIFFTRRYFTVAQKFAKQWSRYKVFVHLLLEILADSFLILLMVYC